MRGFTLIETFVAISILLTSIMGPLSLASQGLSSAITARDQLTAGFLAQDAIEFIRWKRDSNSLTPQDWLTGITVGSPISIDSATKTISSCGATCPLLHYNEATGFYTYNPNDRVTNLRRTILVTSVSAGEVKVAVTIEWQNNTRPHTFVVQENIFNWQ